MNPVISTLSSSRTDFVVFACGSILVFAVAVLGIPRWWRGARFPWPAWALGLVTVMASWWSIERAGDEARGNIERLVTALAPTYAIELERLGHAQITTETSSADPRYQQLISAILKWQKANPFAHDIYTVRRLRDGSFAFIVDAETDYNRDGKFTGEIEARTPIGEPFLKEDKGIALALNGSVNFNTDVVEDRWGRWVGAWAPILGPDGKVDAVVGVDFDAGEWNAVGAVARRSVIFRYSLVLALIALSGIVIALLRADIRQRVIAERELRNADERMKLTIRQMPIAFIEWDAGARVRLWNPAAERIFGFKAADVLGRHVFPLIVAPAAREHVDKIWTSLIENKGGSHSINDNITRDGRTIVCEWFNTPLIGPDGARGAFSLAQDITERVNLERHVQQAERMNAVGQLAAGVAHDFNNILTIITGEAGLLLGQDRLPPGIRPELERIEEAAIRAAGLTRQLLTFSRQQAMFPRALRLGELVKASTGMLARILGEDVSLSVRSGDGPLAIEADAAMIEQIVTNLVLNARDAMPRGGAITVATEAVHVSEDAARCDADARPGPAVRLSVTDTGAGISEDDMPRIFEPFFTTKQTGKGTGLGLSVVHGVVKQHHGWIEVLSTVGKGTTFHVYFPPTDKEPAPSAAHPKPANGARHAAARRTIMLVEDETMVRDIARLILERSGYVVLTADSGPAALDVWRQHQERIDLLLTDMVMPGGMTGRELSLRLFRDRPDLPVIYASGYSVELTAPDFRETPRQVFLAKPYVTDQLLTTVEKCLAASASKN